MNRRDALRTLTAGVAAPALFVIRLGETLSAHPDFSIIERRVRGRLGVAALDTATGRRLMHRADERFPMCSTFKWLLAAQVLSRVDAGEERLSRFVRYGHSDLLQYAPVTRAHIRHGGLSVDALAAAAIELSDNTAANLLLRTVGGPASLTAFLRRIGDRVTRLDRVEPELNSAEPADVRDTTTPNAMITDMQELLLGNRLRTASRQRLLSWLTASRTGADRLRAGVPKSWPIGDKTGTGAHGATGDVAIMWPPGRPPILVAAYIAESDAEMSDRNAALAAVGRVIASRITAS